MEVITELLENKRKELELSKRDFALKVLGITEDTYSNWLKKYPKQTKRTVRETVMRTLELTEQQYQELLEAD